MSFVETLKIIVFGLVEGFTEWLPISSTGHMILVNELIRLNQPDEYYKVFEVVIQLGAILAVIVLFFRRGIMGENELWDLVEKRTKKAKGGAKR